MENLLSKVKAKGMKKARNKRIFSFIVCTTMLCAMMLAYMPVQLHAEKAHEVAAIGDIKYATLQEAFNASEDQQTTITLLADFTMKTADIATLSYDKNIILNMNGKKIDVVSDFKGRPIVNEGTMLIKGNGTIDSSMANLGYGAVDNSGNLTIENGTYSGYILGDGSVIRNTSGNLVINGGTFNKATAAVYNDAGASAVINGGVFDGRTCSSDNPDIWSYTFRNEGGTLEFNNGTVYGVQGALAISGGTATINGGHFETLPCATHGPSTSFYALYVAGEAAVVQTTVNGGEFISADKVAALIGNDADGGNKEVAKCIINGGNFTTKGAGDVMGIAPGTGQPSLRGGTYNKAVTKGIESGYACYAKDGKYVVTPTPSGIVLSKSALSIKEGDSDTISATITPSTSAAKEEWSSSDDTIASVKDGVITAKKTGIATITVKAGDKTANATITVFKMTTPTIPPAVDGSKPVDDVTIGIGKETTTNISKTMDAIIDALNNKEAPDGINKATADKLKTAIASGKTVTSELQSNNLTEKEVAKTDVAKIKAVMDEHATIAQYLDLEVLLKADGETLGNITAFEDKLTFTVAVPEDLKVEGRTFYVIRLHDGVADKLNTTLNKDGTLSFETNRLSIYAIVYEDNRDTTGVNTGDTTSMILPIMFMMASCTLMGIVVVLKKKQALLK